MSRRSHDRTGQRTTVLLIGDDAPLTEALRLIRDEPDALECVGLAATMGDGLALAARRRPDVALVDVDLGEPDGIEGVSQLKRLHPGTGAIVLTDRADVEVMGRAAAAGASGLFSKQGPLDEIIDIIHAVPTLPERGMFVGIHVLFALVEGGEGQGGPAPRPTARRSPPWTVSPREREVLDLMGEGLDTKAIARRLGISVNTCRGYVKSLFAKLGAHNKVEAVVKAMAEGLLPGPPS